MEKAAGATTHHVHACLKSSSMILDSVNFENNVRPHLSFLLSNLPASDHWVVLVLSEHFAPNFAANATIDSLICSGPMKPVRPAFSVLGQLGRFDEGNWKTAVEGIFFSFVLLVRM